MQITFDEKKRLDTNPIFHLFVQGENMAESIRIVGPKMVGALDLSQLRMAVRVTSAAYETMVEKTLEQTVSDEGTITLVWNVDRQFTSNPGHVQVMLVGYGNNEEVIKITSSGIEVKEDETFISAPQGNTWEQILREMQELATQASASQTAAAASADRAAASEQVAISKAEEIENAAEQTAANAKAAAQSAQEAAESAASIDPSKLVKSVNGEHPVDGAVSVTTRNLAYRVGDTITTTDESFDPNTAIGGTWTQNVTYTKDVPFTQITLPEGVTVQNPSVTGYLVRNGICFLYMDGVYTSKVGPIALDIPRAAIQVAQYTIDRQSLFIPLSYGYIQANGPINGHAVTLSYPVLDNDVTKAYVWSKTA